MINILYIHETSQISGAENSLFNLVTRLDKIKPYFILPEIGPFKNKLENTGIKVEVINLPQIRKFTGVISTIKKITDFVKRYNINIIHSNSIRSNIYASLAGKLVKVPVVWHQRNLITYELVDLDRLFSFLPDKIICNSKAISNRFKQNKKVIVIYNGVDTDIFTPQKNGTKIRQEFGINREDIVIGITSRFGADKGQEHLLKAARLVLDIIDNKYTDVKSKKIKFLIVGSAVFKEEKQKEKYLIFLTKELNLTDNVIFAGYRTDMPEIYAAMDIFVLTSYAEPCGRVILEAMASGKPLIVTNTGGTTELVDSSCSIIIPPKDEISLKEAIIELINDKNKRILFGRNARERAEKLFTIEKNVEQIQNVYFELLKLK